MLLPIALAGLAGVALGAFFFGGLWWTLRRALVSPRPLLWLGTSVLLRSGIVLFGVYVVGHGQWQRMVACLAGFILVRLLTLRLAGRAPMADEVRRAP
ncbi:MAG: ATP synthase subunit I [Rhodoferax sp.]|nr:ATP synthase subunit I [Rhodoferax sp.]